MSKEIITQDKKEEGASMVEYGLLLALIAIVVIGALTFLGEQVSGKFSVVASEVNRAGT